MSMPVDSRKVSVPLGSLQVVSKGACAAWLAAVIRILHRRCMRAGFQGSLGILWDL